jgi:xylulokinase
METFLGIDVGTSSIKAILVDADHSLIADASSPLQISRPRPLWSEQDPADWIAALEAAIAKIRAIAPEAWSQVHAIGLSGQQHGATLLDASGQVLRPCILWNDGRSQAECAELTRRVPDFAARASNIAMPGFTAPKLLWVAKHEPEIFAKVAKVLLPKDYVRYYLSGAYVSEMSDSAGTLWLDIAGRRWDETLLAATGLTTREMPSLVEGSAVSANLSADLATRWGLSGRTVVIAGGGGDNACSAVGIGATRPGDGFVSLGTSGVSFVVTDHAIALPERTLHAFCHALPGRWHGMSVALSAALALDWITAITGQSGNVAGAIAAAEAYASDVDARTEAPVFLPYLTGERTPHNDPLATAQFGGLTAKHGAAALTYAVIEGVTFALADGLDVLSDAGAAPTSCMLVGGGSRSAYWAELIADVTGVQLDLPAGAELGAAFGAARLAMLSAGGSEADICTKPDIRRTFVPDTTHASIIADRRQRYRALYRR